MPIKNNGKRELKQNKQSNLFLDFFKTIKLFAMSPGVIRWALKNCLPRRRCVFVLFYTLMQMTTCIANITCVTQVTLKFIYQILLADKHQLTLACFEILFYLFTRKHRLTIDTNLGA